MSTTARLLVTYIQQAQLNKEVTANAGFDAFDACAAIPNAGSPNGVVTGSPGDLCRDTTNGLLYVKATGTATNTGWLPLSYGPSPYWQKFTVPYTLFNGVAGLTSAQTLFTLPAKNIIHAVTIRPTASFTGGSISAFTLSVGIAGNATKYASAFDCFQAPGNTVFQTSSVMGMENAGAGTIIQVNATATGANLNTLGAGSAEIEALVSALL